MLKKLNVRHKVDASETDVRRARVLFEGTLVAHW